MFKSLKVTILMNIIIIIALNLKYFFLWIYDHFICTNNKTQVNQDTFRWFGLKIFTDSRECLQCSTCSTWSQSVDDQHLKPIFPLNQQPVAN